MSESSESEEDKLINDFPCYSEYPLPSNVNHSAVAKRYGIAFSKFVDILNLLDKASDLILDASFIVGDDEKYEKKEELRELWNHIRNMYKHLNSGFLDICRGK